MTAIEMALTDALKEATEELGKLRLEKVEYVNQLTECYFAIGALKEKIDKLNETLQTYLKTIGG